MTGNCDQFGLKRSQLDGSRLIVLFIINKGLIGTTADNAGMPAVIRFILIPCHAC